MKGQVTSVITMIVIGGIFIITIMIALMIPLLVFKIHIDKNINIQTGYSNAELALMTLLTSKSIDYTSQEEIANHLVFNDPDNMDSVEERLNLFFESDTCFKLTASGRVLASNYCSAEKYKAETKIPLPYSPGKLTEELELVIG